MVAHQHLDQVHEAGDGVGRPRDEEHGARLGRPAEGDGVASPIRVVRPSRGPERALDVGRRGPRGDPQLTSGLSPIHLANGSGPDTEPDAGPVTPPRAIPWTAMGASGMGLRQRKKLATETALLESALELFHDRGYDETTVQDIADTAGVSQRTFFRYFATKDAVLLTEHTRREVDLRLMLSRRPVEEPGDLGLAILLHLAGEVSDADRSARTRTEEFAGVPSLADRFAGHHDRLVEIIAAHVAEGLGVAIDTDPRPSLVASQVVACWTTAVHLWMVGGTDGDLRSILIDILTAARSDRALVDAPAVTD